MAALAPRWRALFGTALFTGLRKGELLGLRKEDIDLSAGTITVQRSYDADTTKGGHADVIPIPEPVRPYVAAAMQETRSGLVFPREDGTMHSRDVALDHVLRRALGRAGVVVGYDHVCRRKGCGYSSREQHAEPARCPKCRFRLWSKAVPRHVRFHDLRHTTATLLLKAGVPLQFVQRILRHLDPKLTAMTYGHLDVEDQRRAMAQFPVTLPPLPSDEGPLPVEPSRSGERIVAVAGRPLGAPVGADRDAGKTKAAGPLAEAKRSSGLTKSGRQDLNLRPLGPEPSALPG